MPASQSKSSQSQSQWSTKQDFKFSAGPWNLHPGADPFGPTVRPEREFAAKLKRDVPRYKKLIAESGMEIQ